MDALSQWPESGVPRNAGAWLTAVAKRKAIDGWRRRERLDERYRAIAHEFEEAAEDEWQPIPDDVLRLIFTACHPVLSREAQVSLTLRVVGGLTTEEIARMLLIPVATVQQRIVRAKKTLSAATRFRQPLPNATPSLQPSTRPTGTASFCSTRRSAGSHPVPSSSSTGLSRCPWQQVRKVHCASSTNSMHGAPCAAHTCCPVSAANSLPASAG